MLSNLQKGTQNKGIHPLSQSVRGVAPPSNQSQTMQTSPYIRVTGFYNFYIEPTFSGEDPPGHTCILFVKAFTKQDCKYAIAVSCRWFRMIEDIKYPLPVQSNTFQLSPNDIGCNILCEVKSEEDEFTGTASITFGPIKLSNIVRDRLDKALGTESSKHSVLLVNEAKDLVGKEKSSFTINKEMVRISLGEPTKGVSFKFGINSPAIETDVADVTKLVFVFKGSEEDYEKMRHFLGISQRSVLKLGIKTASKEERDLILMLMRIFSAKCYLINAKIIEDYSNFEVFNRLTSVKGGQVIPPPFKTINDFFIEVERLKREMHLLVFKNKELTEERDKMKDQVKRLEEEVQSTINTYRKIVSNESPPNARNEERIKKLESEKSEMVKRIAELENNQFNFSEIDMRDMRNSFVSDLEESIIPKSGQNFNDRLLEAENYDLKRKLFELESRLRKADSELNEEKARNSDRFGSGKEEILKLKNLTDNLIRDNELLRSENATLNRQIQQESMMLKFESAKKAQASDIFLGSPVSPIGSPPNLASEISKLTEEKRQLQEDLNKINKESIIQRGKLIEERENLKKELEKIKSTSNSVSIGTIDIKNLPSNQLSGFASPNERETLTQELELIKKTSIIERGKLIDERNKLKEELKNLKLKMGLPLDRSGFLNDSISMNITAPAQMPNLDSIEKKELEEYRKRTIIEMGKLLEERNSLREENEKLKSLSARAFEYTGEKTAELEGRRKHVLEEVENMRQDRERDRLRFEEEKRLVTKELDFCKNENQRKNNEILNLRMELADLERKQEEKRNLLASPLKDLNTSVFQEENKYLRNEIESLRLKERENDSLKLKISELQFQTQEMSTVKIRSDSYALEIEKLKKDIFQERASNLEEKNKIEQARRALETRIEFLESELRRESNEKELLWKEFSKERMKLFEELDSVKESTKKSSPEKALTEDREKLLEENLSLRRDISILKEKIQTLINNEQDNKKAIESLTVERNFDKSEIKILRENISEIDNLRESIKKYEEKQFLMKSQIDKLEKEREELQSEKEWLYKEKDLTGRRMSELQESLERLSREKFILQQELSEIKVSQQRELTDLRLNMDTVVKEKERMKKDIERVNKEKEKVISERDKLKTELEAVVAKSQREKINDECENTKLKELLKIERERISNSIEEAEKMLMISQRENLEMKNEIIRLKEEINNQSNLQRKVTDKEALAKDLQILLENNKVEISNMKQEIQILQSELLRRDQKIAELSSNEKTHMANHMKLLNNYDSKDRDAKELKARLTNAQSDLAILTRDKEKINESLERKTRELKSKEDEFKTIGQELQEAQSKLKSLKQEKDDLGNWFEKSQQENRKMAEYMEKLKKDLESFKLDNAKLSTEISAINLNKEQTQGEIKRLSAHMEQQTKEKLSLGSQLEIFKAEKQGLLLSIENFKKDIESLTRQHSIERHELQTKLEVTKAEYKALEQKLKDLSSKASEAEGHQEDLEAKILEKTERIEALSVHSKKLEAEIRIKFEQLESQKEKTNALEFEIAGLKDILSENTNKLENEKKNKNALETRLDSLSEKLKEKERELSVLISEKEGIQLLEKQNLRDKDWWEKTISSLKAEKKDLFTEMELTQKKVWDLENMVRTLSESNTKLTQTNSILNLEKLKNQEELRERLESLKCIETQYMSTTQNKDKLETDMSAKERIMDTLRDEKAQLESGMEKLNARIKEEREVMRDEIKKWQDAVTREQEDKKSLREKANNLIHTEKIENANLRTKLNEREQEILDITKKIAIESAQRKKLQDTIDMMANSKMTGEETNSEALKALNLQLNHTMECLNREVKEKELLKIRHSELEDRLNVSTEREILNSRDLDRVRGENKAIKQESDGLKEYSRALQNEIENLKDEKEKLGKALSKVKDAQEKSIEENETLKAQALKLSNEINAMKGLNDRHKDLKERSFNEMNSEIQNLIEKLDQEREERIRVTSKLQELQIKFDQDQRNIRSLEENLNDRDIQLVKQREEYEEKLQRIKSELNVETCEKLKLESDVKRLSKDISIDRNTIELIKSNLEEREREISTLNEDKKRISRHCEELRIERDRLSENLSNLNDNLKQSEFLNKEASLKLRETDDQKEKEVQRVLLEMSSLSETAKIEREKNEHLGSLIRTLESKAREKEQTLRNEILKFHDIILTEQEAKRKSERDLERITRDIINERAEHQRIVERLERSIETANKQNSNLKENLKTVISEKTEMKKLTEEQLVNSSKNISMLHKEVSSLKDRHRREIESIGKQLEKEQEESSKLKEKIKETMMLHSQELADREREFRSSREERVKKSSAQTEELTQVLGEKLKEEVSKRKEIQESYESLIKSCQLERESHEDEKRQMLQDIKILTEEIREFHDSNKQLEATVKDVNSQLGNALLELASLKTEKDSLIIENRAFKGGANEEKRENEFEEILEQIRSTSQKLANAIVEKEKLHLQLKDKEAELDESLKQNEKAKKTFQINEQSLSLEVNRLKEELESERRRIGKYENKTAEEAQAYEVLIIKAEERVKNLREKSEGIERLLDQFKSEKKQEVENLKGRISELMENIDGLEEKLRNSAREKKLSNETSAEEIRLLKISEKELMKRVSDLENRLINKMSSVNRLSTSSFQNFGTLPQDARSLDESNLSTVSSGANVKELINERNILKNELELKRSELAQLEKIAESLSKTNENLIKENALLLEENRRLGEAQTERLNSSWISTTEKQPQLYELSKEELISKVETLQRRVEFLESEVTEKEREIEEVLQEKDNLLVDLSKMYNDKRK